ncbi:PilW family protein [Candidatus Litorirhabdus singularis]|nr:PilW family protein [Candidatus Litorirhabdus singularis]
MRKTVHKTQFPGRRKQRGLGLVEIMIAMLLVVFMFNGLMEIFLSSRQTYTATDNLTRLQETGRASIDILVSGLRRSGYLGGNSDISFIEGSLGPFPARTNCPKANNKWGRMISQSVFGKDDTRGGYGCIDDTYLRGDILTVRYASQWEVDTADMVATRMYLRSSLFEGKLFLGSDQANTINTVYDTPQRQHEWQAFSYYVANTTRTCNGAPVPALYRERLNAVNRPVSEELIAGVENIQFQYNIGNRYVNASNGLDWNSVISVKVWVLVRAECPETGYVDNGTYVMGNVSPDYTPNDSYRRQLYSTVVALRNL